MEEFRPPESLYGEAEVKSAAKPPSLLDQLVGVLTDPAPLFQRLHAAPTWTGALVLLTALNLVFSVIWALRVNVDEMIRPVLERNPKIPAESYDGIIAMQSRFMLPFSILGGLLGMAIICLFIALIYWLVTMFTAEDQKPTYRQVFSATVVSSLVMAPKFLLLTIICALKNFGGAKPDALSPTSLGFYLQPDNLKLHAFYNTLDLFSIASLVILYFAVRYGMKTKPAGAVICMVITALFTFALPVLGAR